MTTPDPDPAFIPHSRPLIGEAEQEAVSRVLSCGQLAQGPVVEAFEREFAGRFGFENAVATSSGTSALHLALLGLGIGRGDEVVLPAYVCTALLNAVNYVGATPVLADVDPDSGNIAAAGVKDRLSRATRAVIVPHMFGLPVDLEPFFHLGVPIVEDCAQAVGAEVTGRPVGAFGDVAIFSFYATKLMTTGEGGMVVCRSPDVAERLRDLRSYDGRGEYKTRYNYKLTDVQAAVGRCQLAQLDEMLARREAIADLYYGALRDSGLHLPPKTKGRIFFRFVAGIESGLSGWLDKMAEFGIGCARPVHKPLNACLAMSAADFPGTEEAHRRHLSIPIYPALAEGQVERVAAALRTCAASLG